MRLRKIIYFGVICLFLLGLILWDIRFFSLREIDDVHPDLNCSNEYLSKSDVLWIVPDFNGRSILNESGWCERIKNLNKSLGLHGVRHNFNEFNGNLNGTYLDFGIDIFEKCFGLHPDKFKPPQLAISYENRKLVESRNMETKGKFNQMIHKVYHCNDSGRFSNKFIDWF